jgi:uncharacterized protein YbaR (Trm112 family)
MERNGAADYRSLSRGSRLIDSDFLKILGCPLHPERPPFEQHGEYLVCTVAGHGFPIVNGIPHLLPENVIEPEKLKELLSGHK